MLTKTIVLVNRKPPYGSVYAQESIELAMTLAPLEQNLKLIFIDDGVYQLIRQQEPQAIGMKNFSNKYHALADFGEVEIIIDEPSMKERGLATTDIMSLVYEKDNGQETGLIHFATSENVADLIDEADVLFNF